MEVLPVTSQKWVLRSRPSGAFDPERDVALERETIAEVGAGLSLVQVELLSVDAFIRTTLDAEAFHTPVAIGGVVPALGVGRIIAGKGRGRRVFGMLGARTHAVLDPSSSRGVRGRCFSFAAKKSRSDHRHSRRRSVVGSSVFFFCFSFLPSEGSFLWLLRKCSAVRAKTTVRNVRNNVRNVRTTPRRAGLAPVLCSSTQALGLCCPSTGLTAYVGVYKVCRPPRRGETAVVSAAGGAVGCVAAQLCRRAGAFVVGIAGGEGRCRELVARGVVDAAVDYRSGDVGSKLDALCPKGVDFFYDNVGGEILDVVLDRITRKARVVICGGASQYSGNLNANRDGDGRGGSVRGPRSYLKLAEKSASMHGFVVFDFLLALAAAIPTMLYYGLVGAVTMHEHREVGIQAFPIALAALFPTEEEEEEKKTEEASPTTDRVRAIRATRIGKLIVDLSVDQLPGGGEEKDKDDEGPPSVKEE